MKFGRYKVLSELGKGAMGVVYRCHDPQIGRTVAIKTMLINVSPAFDEAELKERLFKEARAAGVLSHPNIVTIYDVGQEADIIYIVMECLEGVALSELVKDKRPVSFEEAIAVAEQVGGALDYAHKQGVIHRDVKPANIMRLEDGRHKLMDFGIARLFDATLTQTGALIGSPVYMSPEQVDGEELTGQSDIYSLGAVVFELLSGRRPFSGDNINALLIAKLQNRRLSLTQINPSLPPALENFFDYALAVDRSKRYSTGEELARALKTAVYSQPRAFGYTGIGSSTIIKPPPAPSAAQQRQDDAAGGSREEHRGSALRMGRGECGLGGPGWQDRYVERTVSRPTEEHLEKTEYNPQADQSLDNTIIQGKGPPSDPSSAETMDVSDKYRRASESEIGSEEGPPCEQPPESPPASGARGFSGITDTGSATRAGVLRAYGSQPQRTPSPRRSLGAGGRDGGHSSGAGVDGDSTDSGAIRQEFEKELMRRAIEHQEEITHTSQVRYKQEINRLTSILRQHPESTEIVMALARLHQGVGRYSEAIIEYKRALKLVYKVTDAWDAIGEIYHLLGMQQRAYEIWNLSEILKDYKMGKLPRESYYPLSKMLEKEHLLRGAIDVMEETIVLEPGNLRCWRDLGHYYLKMKNYREAIRPHRHIVALDSRDAMAWRNLAVCYQNTRQYRDALLAWERSLQVESKGPGAKRARQQIKTLTEFLRAGGGAT